MRAGQIIILWIAFTGLLSAQRAPQGPTGSAAKIPPARTEKKSPAPKLTAPVPIFHDIAAQAGLTASHISSREKYYVIESMSGGVGLFDCDNDGKLDIVMVNGSTVDRYKQGGDPLVTLWHQDANLKFTDITEKAGLTRKGWGMGVAVADFDTIATRAIALLKTSPTRLECVAAASLRARPGRITTATAMSICSSHDMFTWT